MIRHMDNILKEILEAGKSVDIWGSCHGLNFRESTTGLDIDLCAALHTSESTPV
jgi:hypothetical protein